MTKCGRTPFAASSSPRVPQHIYSPEEAPFLLTNTTLAKTMVPYYLLSIFALQVFDLAAALPNYGLRRQVSNNGTVGDGQVQLDISNCPGYTASKVTTTESSLSADLTLAGTACNVYGDDLKDLKLLVEYQTGETRLNS